MKIKSGFALSMVWLAMAAPLSASDTPAPMSAQDLATLPRLGASTASADGQWVLYPVTETDRETYARSAKFYLRNLTASQAEPILLDLPAGASDAKFAPDGTVFFLSSGPDGKGPIQVWRTTHKAGTQQQVLVAQVTDFVADVAGFSISPNGRKIAVWGDIPRDCETFGCADTPAAHLPGPGTGRLYDGEVGFIRHWDSWETPGRHSRVFTFDLVNGTAAGKGVAADGPAAEGALVGDAPTKPFGGGEDVAWAPDSSGIYFAARMADAEEPLSTNVDIYWSGSAGGAPHNLTAANLAFDSLPAPSPDGKWLAYVAMARPGYEADRKVIQLRDLKTGKTRALTQDFDRSFDSIAWTPDSRWIVATAQDVLDTPAFRIDPRTGAIERLDLMPGNEAHIGDVATLPGQRLLFTRNSIGAPSELYLSANWQQARPVTSVATMELGKLASVVIRRFSFAGANGDTVWGQITKPEGRDGKPTENLPAILYVHGGPQGSFNDSWSTRWNPRVVASQGYAVISIDFHGSTGYGQAFTDAITLDWGGKPLEDLQKGLAAALALDPQIDGTRACAMGASYGGYMMNWIAGQWPDRFNCLVQHDGVFDQRAMYYETEELWFVEWEHGGKAYFEDPAAFERWNPVNYVQNWKTPMLVITGEKDFRIPYTQGIASFTALQRKGIPAQLLVFPDENHWVLKPKNSVQWHNTVFEWLDRWLAKPQPDAE